MTVGMALFIGVMIGLTILMGIQVVRLALHLRKFKKDMEGIKDPLERAKRAFEELEWLKQQPGAKLVLGSKIEELEKVARNQLGLDKEEAENATDALSGFADKLANVGNAGARTAASIAELNRQLHEIAAGSEQQMFSLYGAQIDMLQARRDAIVALAGESMQTVALDYQIKALTFAAGQRELRFGGYAERRGDTLHAYELGASGYRNIASAAAIRPIPGGAGYYPPGVQPQAQNINLSISGDFDPAMRAYMNSPQGRQEFAGWLANSNRSGAYSGRAKPQSSY